MRGAVSSPRSLVHHVIGNSHYQQRTLPISLQPWHRHHSLSLGRLSISSGRLAQQCVTPASTPHFRFPSSQARFLATLPSSKPLTKCSGLKTSAGPSSLSPPPQSLPPPPPPPLRLPPPSSSPSSSVRSSLDRLGSRLDSFDPLSSLPSPPRFSKWVLRAIIALNVIVVVIWYRALITQDERFILFMHDHSFFSSANLLQGRWWTLITSLFTHGNLSHCLVNVMQIEVLGIRLLSVAQFSPGRFIAFYLVSGAFAKVGSLLWSAFAQHPLDRWSIGASGPVSAIMACLTVLEPKKFMFFPLPAPSWSVMTAILTWDLYNAIFEPDSLINSRAHISGALFGFLWGWRIKRLRQAGKMMSSGGLLKQFGEMMRSRVHDKRQKM